MVSGVMSRRVVKLKSTSSSRGNSAPVKRSIWRPVSLALPSSGNLFGYYSYANFPYLYHFDLGFEYFVDANDPARGAFLYDFASGSWFYTSPSFPFPYLYDFGLNALLYYYPQAGSADRYTRDPRYFFNFTTGQIIIK